MNQGLRIMRDHLTAIETRNRRGRLLVFDQPSDVAQFVRALGSVAKDKESRTRKQLKEMNMDEMVEELAKSEALRPALLKALGLDKEHK